MSYPDRYEVDVEMNMRDPLPEFFGDWVLAQWLGITRDDLREMPYRDVEEARVTMYAITRAKGRPAT